MERLEATEPEVEVVEESEPRRERWIEAMELSSSETETASAERILVRAAERPERTGSSEVASAVSSGQRRLRLRPAVSAGPRPVVYESDGRWALVEVEPVVSSVRVSLSSQSASSSPVRAVPVEAAASSTACASRSGVAVAISSFCKPSCTMPSTRMTASGEPSRCLPTRRRGWPMSVEWPVRSKRSRYESWRAASCGGMRIETLLPMRSALER